MHDLSVLSARPKRYFVAGCAGFLGAAVTRRLVQNGHDVIGLDNLSPDYDPLVKRFRLAALAEDPRFRFHARDLVRADELERTFDWAAREQPFDAVLHFAGRAGNGALRPHAAFKVTTAGTLRLLELCRRHSVPRFVLASGPAEPTPIGAALMGAEGLCRAHHHLHGTHVGLLRFREIYGPAGRPDRDLFRYVRWISEGEPAPVPELDQPPIDYVYLDDAVAGVLAALDAEGCRTWEIASGRTAPLWEVIEILSILIGRPGRSSPSLPPIDAVLPGEAAVAFAGQPEWRPTVSLASGLCATLEWYESCRDVTSLIDLGIEGRKRSRRTAARYRQKRRDAA